MALTGPTLLTADPDTSNVASYATPSVSPPANSLVIVGVWNTDGADAITPTLSSAFSVVGSTWTNRTSVQSGNLLRRLTIFSAICTGSPGSGAITADFGGDAQTGCIITAVYFEGHDTTTPIPQATSTEGGGAGATSITTTLASLVNAQSIHCAWIGHSTAEDQTGINGATELASSEVNYATPSANMAVYYAVNDIQFGASWTTSNSKLAASVEIAEAAGGGTPYTMSPAGTITPAGAILKAVAKPLGGTITPAGALLKAIAKFFAGTITPAGAESNNYTPGGGGGTNFPRSFAGTITPAGTLAKVGTFARALGGTITPAATIAKIATLKRSYAGTITPAGALAKSKNAVRAFAGTITPAGALTRVRGYARSLGGTITPAGAYTRVRTIFRTFTGTISPGGALERALNGVLVFFGIIDHDPTVLSMSDHGATSSPLVIIDHDPDYFLPAGTRLYVQNVGGTLSFAGSQAKTASYGRSFGGTVTSAGAPAKVRGYGRSFGGTITPAAAYSALIPTPQTCYLGIASGQTDARTAAELARYKILIIHVWQYDRIAAIKALNPTIKILAYKDMTGMTQTPQSPTGLYMSGVPKSQGDSNPTWFLRDSITGNPVPFSDFTDTYFANQGLTAYQDAWSSNVLAELALYGFDGVFADDVNDEWDDHYFGGDIQDPLGAPGAVMPMEDYAANTRSMLVNVGADFTSAGKLFVTNISNAVPLVTWTDWLTLVDASTREFYTKFGTGNTTSNTPVYPAVSNTRFINPDWVNEIPPFQQAANAGGGGFIPITYGPIADVMSQRYARASFLLDWDETNTYSALCFSDAASPTTDSFQADWTRTVGTPLEEKYNVDGGTNWYARRFTNGYVVLNATATAHTFDLTGGVLLDQNSADPGTSDSIGPAQAMVYTGTPPALPIFPFGKTVAGASWNNANSDYINGNLWEMPYAGQEVTKLTAYLDGNGPGAGNQQMRAAIYSNVAGVPTALLGVSNLVTLTDGAAAAWVDFTFPSPIAVSATDYWLCLWFGYTGSTGRWAYDSGTTDQWAYVVNFFDASDPPDDPFPADPGYGAVAFSIYATYQAV